MANIRIPKKVTDRLTKQIGVFRKILTSRTQVVFWRSTNNQALTLNRVSVACPERDRTSTFTYSRRPTDKNPTDIPWWKETVGAISGVRKNFYSGS